MSIKFTNKYITKGYQHIWLPYAQMQIFPQQLEVESAKGAIIKLKDGREIIDGISSWWSVAHGYNHPKIISALVSQAKKIPHIMIAGFANEQTYKLAFEIAKITPSNLNKVFFSDSGSTAVEVAMKIAMQYYINRDDIRFKSRRTKFVSFKNGYHGDTTGAMSLADNKKGMHRKFSDYLPKNFNLEIPQNNIQFDQFEDFISKNHLLIAGVIIEPLVQCAGGMIFHTPQTLKKIYDIIKKYNLFFIVDECATGFFRTGKYFACNHADIKPDIMIIGKALTGGALTLAATVVTDEIYNEFNDKNDIFKALMHGPTFMGNPLACAAANASIDLFYKNNYEKKVFDISKILTQELKKCYQFDFVKDVRVLGAIGVVELDMKFDELIKLREDFLNEGVWLRPFYNVIYVIPPLLIKEVELLRITDSIFKVLSKL